jgi:predicted transcriptional regulator
MVPVKSFMVPKDKFITVERDMDVRSAGRVMRDRNIGSLVRHERKRCHRHH